MVVKSNNMEKQVSKRGQLSPFGSQNVGGRFGMG